MPLLFDRLSRHPRARLRLTTATCARLLTVRARMSSPSAARVRIGCCVHGSRNFYKQFLLALRFKDEKSKNEVSE